MTLTLLTGLAGLGLVGLWVRAAGAHTDGSPRQPRWASEPPVDRQTAEARSLTLLKSVINADEWSMFRELGFICVTGRRLRPDGTEGLPRYRYLLYPHLPLVAVLPRSLAPVREYCIQFPDLAAGGDGTLPIGDDLLAKWMTVRADESRLHANANVATAGCQVPLQRIERDLRRYVRWVQAREHALA